MLYLKGMTYMFKKDEMVWCRPRLIDEPILGKYIEKMSDEEIKKGYRDGHFVEINGVERWVNLGFCSLDREVVENMKW